jgi:hypothetical protein
VGAPPHRTALSLDDRGPDGTFSIVAAAFRLGVRCGAAECGRRAHWRGLRAGSIACWPRG